MAVQSPGADLSRALQKKALKHPGELVVRGVLFLAASVSILTTVAIVFTLLRETLTFFEAVPISRFLSLTEEWSPRERFDQSQFGVRELVAGTFNVVFYSMLFALPIGLGAAIYLSEYAGPGVRKILKPVLEILAGVPTVVYAFFALTFVTQDVLQPIFGSRINFFNPLAASLMLAVMILPTIASVSEDAMSSVPRELREGAYGLGATRFEVAIRVVFPAALSGIMAAILLAIARVVGETMIVAVAAGSSPNATLSPLESIQTMTGYMLQVGIGDVARGTTQYQALFAVGFTLFMSTLMLNIGAQVIIARFRERYD
jgi:phosphate transport system permease protein